jgi:hypothetical protein
VLKSHPHQIIISRIRDLTRRLTFLIANITSSSPSSSSDTSLFSAEFDCQNIRTMAMRLIGLARGLSLNHHDSHRRRPSFQQEDTIQDTIHYTPSPYNPEYAPPPRRMTVGDEPPPPYTEVAPPEARVPQPAVPTRSSTQRQTQPRPRAPSEPVVTQTRLPIRTASQSQSRREDTRLPTRNASLSQARQEQMRITPTRTPSQAQTPTRTQSQSQSRPQPTAVPQYTIPPPYQQPTSQAPQSPTRTSPQSPPQSPPRAPPRAPPRSSPEQAIKYIVIDATPDTGVCNCVYKDGFGLAPKCRKCERKARRGGSGNGERRRRRHRDGPIGNFI